MAHLDSDLLRTFVVVADCGNFTKAGEIIGRSQSAISVQIRRLEQMAGAPMFQRGRQGVRLTAEGVSLLGNARRIVSILDETESLLRTSSVEGPIRIGIPEEYGHAVLSTALGAFSRRHPSVQISVRYTHSAIQKTALETGELDLAVVFEWEGPPQGEVLMPDPTVWVTSDLNSPHEFRPLPIALYNTVGWCRWFAMGSLERSGIDYRVAYITDTHGGLRLAVTSGLAVAPVSRSNIPRGCRELTASEGFGEIDASNLVLMRNPKSASPAIDGLADAIRMAFADYRGA